MILVVGGTGTVGSEVLRGLRESRERVRALVRAPDRAAAVEALGAEPVHGDLGAPETLPPALDGIDRAFVVLPATPDLPAREAAFARAAAEAGGVHVVRISVVGADPNAPVAFLARHGQAERTLREAGIPHTVLRSNDHMQNSLRWAPGIRREGRVFTPNADVRIASVDARDVAAVAVAVLTGQAEGGRRYVLSGPEALTRHEQVARIAAAIGLDVDVVGVTNEQARDAVRDAGAPPHVVDGLYELWRHVYDAGYAAEVADGVREATGRDPVSWERFARDHADAWR